MSDSKNTIHQLENKIIELEARRNDLISRLPAHSIPPSMMAELDEIEEQLSQARLQMATLDKRNV